MIGSIGEKSPSLTLARLESSTVMANRPVFIPSLSEELLVETAVVEFDWSAGMSVQQKQKCIASLHDAASVELGLSRILEVSTKSTNQLGCKLSAFNLMYEMRDGFQYPLECIFQSSKVFEKGGPYRDIFYSTPLEAKRDERLKISGELQAFEAPNGVRWPLQPYTLFYDWLYLNILYRQEKLLKMVLEYDAFTDIEFNPKKSLNCQAYSVALLVSLSRRNLLSNALASKDAFTEIVSSHSISNARVNTLKEPDLFN